jgi:hypothetical protein
MYAVSALALFGRTEARRRALEHLIAEPDARIRDRIQQLFGRNGQE